MLVHRTALTLVIAGVVLLGAIHVVTSRGYRFNMQWDKEKHVELAPASLAPTTP